MSGGPADADERDPLELGDEDELEEEEHLDDDELDDDELDVDDDELALGDDEAYEDEELDEDELEAQADLAVAGGAAIPQDMTVLLRETADLADPVEVAAGPGGVTYALGGRPFAWASGPAFEVHLGPEVATAALRTPDVTPSARGTGWIHLEPAAIDDHAADRVVAWFAFARRIAAGRQGGDGAGRRH
jgi:hypothetical protein